MYIYTVISITEFSDGNNVLSLFVTTVPGMVTTRDELLLNSLDMAKIIAMEGLVCEHFSNCSKGIDRIWSAPKKENPTVQ